MPELGQTLTNKVGPLPTWAWAGLGTAGLAGYMLYRKKQSVSAAQAAANSNAVSTNLGTVPISNLTTAAEPMPIQMGDTFINNPPDNTTVNTPVTVNNPAPTVPATPSPSPVIKNPIPPAKSPVTTPKPPAAKLPAAPKPVAPAAKTTTYTVVSGNTLWGIAQKYYGNGALWPTIYNANKALIGANPNLIHPGQKLVIPPKS